MAIEEKFKGVNELYQKILPALNTKEAELHRKKLNNITSKDIWNYCIENIWQNKKDLRIYELVDDILNLDEFKLELYTRKNDRNDQFAR